MLSNYKIIVNYFIYMKERDLPSQLALLKSIFGGFRSTRWFLVWLLETSIIFICLINRHLVKLLLLNRTRLWCVIFLGQHLCSSICDHFVRFAAVGHQLARDLDLKSLNNLGFSKRYVRCLQVMENSFWLMSFVIFFFPKFIIHLIFQISEVVNSMKDLIDFSQDQKIGPLGNMLPRFDLIV